MSPIDPEVEKVLDKHEDRIENLESDVGILQKDLIELKNGQIKVENMVMTGNTSILTAYQTQSQEITKLMGIVIDSLKNQNNNETKLEVNKSKNNTNIFLKIIGIIGGLISAFFAGKNIS